MRLTIKAAWLMCGICTFTLATPKTLIAEEGKTDGVAQAEAEMKKTFGTLPSWMMAYPENARAAAWEWNKAIGVPSYMATELRKKAFAPKYVTLSHI